MTNRDTILGRVREALKAPAPHPHHHTSDLIPPALSTSAQESTPFQQWLPPVEDAYEKKWALFAKNSADLKSEVMRFSSFYDLKQHLNTMIEKESWTKVATHEAPLTSDFINAFASKPNLNILNASQGIPKEELETCEIGITGCDALVAQTGSILITNKSAGGRGLSVLPHHHIVLAHKAQLVGTLTDALKLAQNFYSPNYPSFMSFITGPSRTGDIERILVLGAHGPRRLSVFFVG